MTVKNERGKGEKKDMKSVRVVWGKDRGTEIQRICLLTLLFDFPKVD